METVRLKKNNKKTIQFIEVFKHNWWGGCTWWFYRSSTHRNDIRQQKTVGILNIFQKGLVFRLDDHQFWECRFTQICCAKS